MIKECLEEDGSLYSRKVVNLLIKALGQIQHYKSAEKHRDDEVARLHLMSYPWNFDIVSCFYTAQQFYLIPDGQGNWKNTDPRIDRMRVTSVNQSHYQIALPLIRLMKYWKELKWGKLVSSYMSEPIPLGMSWQVRVTGSSLYYRCR